jgi:hypothetical protein
MISDTISRRTRSKAPAPLHQIDRLRGSTRVQGRQRPLFAERQRAEVVSRTTRADGVELVERWGAEHVENESKLVVVWD